MHCSCPDWARPCKHLVAVMLLLGEEVAQRPFTLLSLRGVDLEDNASNHFTWVHLLSVESIHTPPSDASRSRSACTGVRPYSLFSYTSTSFGRLPG